MIDERTFEALLSRMEDETLDFKSTAPKITYEPDKARFIKDIICMANTPRNEPSYIIYGVKKLPDGSNLLLSLDKDTDEELLQSQFSEERVYPIPVFTYSTVLYQQKTFGIICIPPVRIGVCRPRKGFFDILQPSLVYFRRGSKNAVALPEDIARIVNWMKDGHVSSSEFSPPTDEEWENFLFKVHHFESSRGYLLLAAPLAIEHVYDNISVLGNIPCSMVFDFDPNSESNGLLKYTRETLTKQRSLHLVVI